MELTGQVVLRMRAPDLDQVPAPACRRSCSTSTGSPNRSKTSCFMCLLGAGTAGNIGLGGAERC